MSKQDNNFKYIIKKELDLRAFKNDLFDKKYKNPEKNLDDCIKYIYKTVQESKRSGFTDDEIFGMAVHYYSESDIDLIGSPSNVNVVVNHHVKLTSEEIKELKEKARNNVIEEEMAKIRGKNKKPVKTEPKKDDDNVKTLF